MSANNQILVKEYKGHWYVWNNIMAESWDDGKNEVSIKRAEANFETQEEALKFAYELWSSLEWPDECEYGVGINRLIKDRAEVIVVE